MFSTKSHSLLSLALVAAGALALSVVPGFGATKSGVMLAQQEQPTEQTSPATEQHPDDDSAAPAAPDSADSAGAAGSESPDPATTPDAAPSPDAAAPAADAPSTSEGTDNGSAKTDDSKAAPATDTAKDVTPITPQSPADATESSEPAAATAETPAVEASQLKIGTAVFGSDGQKIGEINGVKSDTNGKVQEILVTDGVAAGLNAKVFAISGDKITGISDGVKLSLTSEEAKKLPIIDNGNG